MRKSCWWYAITRACGTSTATKSMPQPKPPDQAARKANKTSGSSERKNKNKNAASKTTSSSAPDISLANASGNRVKEQGKMTCKQKLRKTDSVVTDATSLQVVKKKNKRTLFHPKTGTAWAVPTKKDLKNLNMVQSAYWYRIWFMRYCSNMGDLEQGAWFHQHSLREQGVDTHVLIGTQLIDMYGKCRATEKAYAVFENIEKKNVVTWNFMLGALVLRSKDSFPERFMRVGYGLEALRLFRRMIFEGAEPNAITFTNAANACASIQSLADAKLVHKMAASRGYDKNDTVLGNTLIRMYYSMLRMGRAITVFKNMCKKSAVTWTQLITCCSRGYQPLLAVTLHQKMQLEGVEQDRASLVSALDACANTRNLNYGKCVHRQVYSAGLESDVFAGTAVVHMYGMCNRIDMALRVFARVRGKNAYSWNSIITALVKAGQYEETLLFYENMVLEGISPDRYTFVAVIDACSELLACDYGQKVHRAIHLIVQNDLLANSLTRFYGNCARLQLSKNTFMRNPARTPESFTLLISAFADHGYADVAVELFHIMSLSGITPLSETFTPLLSVCSYKGRLRQCQSLYHSMSRDFGFQPQREHFRAMIHLLGRSGRLAKMHQVIQEMRFHPGSEEWLCLLAACELHKDVQRGKCAARKMLKLDYKDHVPYEILANIYVEENMLQKAERMIEKMRLNKQRESSFIEVHGKVYKFLEGYKKQRQYERLDEFLKRLRVRMTGAGYVFKATSMTLLKGRVEDESHHSERLAVAFGILKTRQEDAIRVRCKHRMCSDCHAVFKYVSMVFGRNLSVKDCSRFHHFQDGLCSCRDYW